ncbi:hypothetical protein IKG16_00425 [Candidatus Saccharibacteria bacterium]|nr:hypothetical protein [Candidatus Saccharibacteria bacterium]
MARNRNQIDYSRQMRRGQTIVAERERSVSDSERMNLHRKAKRRKVASGVFLIFAILSVGCIVAVVAMNIYGNLKEPEELPTETFEPKVSIEDESGSGLVTSRMREYVGMLENDFGDSGYKVVRAIVPAGKTREIDIYLDGREEFYKTNLDRGTGVTVEDVVRMIKYLDGHDVHPAYVDVRVAGKAYYK